MIFVRLMLDTGVLGMIVHPRKHEDVKDWFRDNLRVAPAEREFLIPEIADYELRRELLRIGSTRSLEALDRLGRDLRYVEIRTPALRRAALLWAETRRAGAPTAGRESLDGDVILAAQALGEDCAVVTENRAHLARYHIQVFRWSDLGPSG